MNASHSKTLSQILKRDCAINPIITGLTSDSRSVRKGFLFVALQGTRSDGREYIEDALRNGAVAILTNADTQKPQDEDFNFEQIEWIVDENPRKALALAAAEFYGAQPETIFAVTGTNGKTSTVSFVRQILTHMNFRAVSLGTLGIEGGGVEHDEGGHRPNSQGAMMTTLDPVSLHAQLADLAAAQITHLALEASSHGLHQHRLDGVNVFAAGFTNLTHDHLDYHGTMENYSKAKLILFEHILNKDGVAVVNADSEEFEKIKRVCNARNIKIFSYGFQGQELKILNLTPTNFGTEVMLDILGQEISFTLTLVGEFQIYNLLCAAGLVLTRYQKRLQEVIDILPMIKGVRGRLEAVPHSFQNAAAIYVDYAHTPDALQNILNALRKHLSEGGRLICVLGCGGDRDRAKRPVMGAVAAELSDIVIITDDNPRSEDPAEIRAAIEKGVVTKGKTALNIEGRGRAIEQAIQLGSAKDIVVIAGKGHEQGQIFKDYVEPFDDVIEAQKALKIKVL